MSELPPELKDSVLRLVAETPSLTRQQRRRTRTGAAALALAAVLLVGLSRGMQPVFSRPDAYVAISAGGAGLLALVASLYALGSLASPLGRRRSALRVLAAAVPPLLAAFAIVAGELAPPVSTRPDPKEGLVCAAVFAALGAVLLGLLTWLERDSDPLDARASAASLGAIAGAWSAFALALRCPAVDLTHVLESHVAPSVLLIAASAFAGARWLALRAPPSHKITP